MPGFYFGSRLSPLYGYLHAPVRGRADRAVLVCPPLGEEAIRAHRALFLLSERLAEAGVAVLRFDYLGTGDSHGSGHDIDFDTMCADIASADEELLELSGVPNRRWLGLRLGALAAAHAAMRMKVDASLLLWNPVYDGQEWVTEARQRHMRAGFPDPGDIDTCTETLGFPISDSLRQGLRTATLADALRYDSARIIGILDETPDVRVTAPFLQETDARAWDSDSALNSFQVPTRSVGRMVEVLSAK